MPWFGEGPYFAIGDFPDLSEEEREQFLDDVAKEMDRQYRIIQRRKRWRMFWQGVQRFLFGSL